MVYRPIAAVLLAGLGSFSVLAQTGSNLLDDSRTATPKPQVTEPERPLLTPEMRGDIYMARRQYREAIDTFREGSLKDPVIRNKIGIAYHQLNQLDVARKEYEQAVKLKPEYVEAINNIGAIYYAKKNYRRAQTYFERSLKIAPDEPKSASIYVNLGSAEFSRKKYVEAAAAFQTAVNLDPGVFERHSNFGVLMEERTIQERAKFHLYLAKLNAKMGRDELALQYLRKALEEGFKDKAQIAAAPEFAKLKDTPDFQELLKRDTRVL